MLALIIKHKHPSFPVSRLIMVINGTIVAVGGFLSFGPVPTLYSVLAAIISSLVINQILDGMNFAKAAFILTDKFEEMSETIMNTLHRGNTGIQARGMYTHQDKVMLFVVVSRKQRPTCAASSTAWIARFFGDHRRQRGAGQGLFAGL